MASEMGEFYTAKRKERQEKNAKRWAENNKQIEKLRKVPGLAITNLDRGSHLRFTYREMRVDFWPSTGAACIVGTNQVKRGFDADSLFRWIKRLAKEADEQKRKAP